MTGRVAVQPQYAVQYTVLYTVVICRFFMSDVCFDVGCLLRCRISALMSDICFDVGCLL